MRQFNPNVLHSVKGTTADTKDKDKFKNLIGATDPKLDREVREKLITARVGLLLKASFFGNLATRLKLVNADEWCATAATDGRHFYYNTRFVNMLRPKEIEFLFGHEVLHCVYDHFGRRGERDPQIWNIANDYCVNGDLKKHNVGEFITSVPCLYDKKYEGMSSEEVYDSLMENAQKISIDDLINQLLDDHLGDEEGEGGSGGGGNAGTAGTNSYGTAGTANTGGGGGSPSYNNTYLGSANGGSGVVILSSTATAASTTGSPTVITSGGNTIYKFTSSGSITF